MSRLTRVSKTGGGEAIIDIDAIVYAEDVTGGCRLHFALGFNLTVIEKAKHFLDVQRWMADQVKIEAAPHLAERLRSVASG